MVQEIISGGEAAPIEAAPVEAPVTEVTTSEDAPVEEAPPVGEETPKPVNIEELIGEDENLKTDYDLRVAEAREEGRRKAQGEIQPKLDKANKMFADNLKATVEANQTLGELRDSLNQAVQDGTLSEPFMQKLMAANPHAFAALNNTAGSVGFYSGQRWATGALAEEIGGEAGAKFSGEFTSRWFQAEGGFEEYSDVLKDQMKAYGEALIEKAKTPLQNRIKALEKQIEQAKAGNKGGPPAAAGTAGGQADLSRKVQDGTASISELKEARKQGLLDY